MANSVIQIKTSLLTAQPPSLNVGELAYSYASNTAFIGLPDTTVIPIGGKFYIDQQQYIYNQANAAFITANVVSYYANLPSHVANSASTYANIAFNLANAASIHANSGFIQANAAFSAANSITTGIGAAYNQANAAFVIANSAAIAANTPSGVANAAYNQANAAFNRANTSGLSVSLIDDANVFSNNVTLVTGLRFDSNSGFDITDLGSGNVRIGMNSTFKTWKIAGQQDLIANGLDTIAFVGSNGVSITSNTLSVPKSITFDTKSLFDVANAAFNTANGAFNTANNANTRTIINGLGNSKLDFNTYGANSAYLTTTSDDSTALFMGAATAELYADTSIQIRTNTDGASKAWTFGDDGSLTLPNGSVIKDTDYLAVAFGSGAGVISQGFFAVAVGSGAGYNGQGNAAVAIGSDAGGTSQGLNAVAVGAGAGYTGQGINAVAIGIQAGYTNQAANSIIINATGATLDQTTANTFTVAPIRNISATSGVLQYNDSTKEVSYSNSVTAETFNTDQITVVGNRISTTVTNANLELECNGSGGVVINTVADATTSSTVKSVGYLGLPQSATATTATLAIGDAGKHIYITTTGQTITIPAASSVAYPIGTTLTFIAGPSATTATIAITTDTLRLAGGTSTGSRTLAANGMATAVKVSGTSSAGVWYINGTGLT
jgi:hypothetical protein